MAAVSNQICAASQTASIRYRRRGKAMVLQGLSVLYYTLLSPTSASIELQVGTIPGIGSGTYAEGEPVPPVLSQKPATEPALGTIVLTVG